MKRACISDRTGESSGEIDPSEAKAWRWNLEPGANPVALPRSLKLGRTGYGQKVNTRSWKADRNDPGQARTKADRTLPFAPNVGLPSYVRLGPAAVRIDVAHHNLPRTRTTTCREGVQSLDAAPSAHG